MAWNVLSATAREGMDRRLFELATIAAARAMRSIYCTPAHSLFLRDGGPGAVHLLCGLPIAPEDGFAVRGLPIRASSDVRAGNVATQDFGPWLRLASRSTVLTPPLEHDRATGRRPTRRLRKTNAPAGGRQPHRST